MIVVFILCTMVGYDVCLFRSWGASPGAVDSLTTSSTLSRSSHCILFPHCLLEKLCAEGQGRKWSHSTFCPLPAGNFLCPCAVVAVIISAGGQPRDLVTAPNHSQSISLKAPGGIWTVTGNKQGELFLVLLFFSNFKISFPISLDNYLKNNNNSESPP